MPQEIRFWLVPVQDEIVTVTSKNGQCSCLGSADISNIQLSPNGELKLHSLSDDIGDMPILLHELN